MVLTLKDLHHQCDFIVDVRTGFSIYILNYENEEEFPTYELEFDNGAPYKSLASNTVVEPTAAGTILLDGEEYRAYVATQIKFEPTKD